MVRGDKLKDYFDSEKLGAVNWHRDLQDASLEDAIVGTYEAEKLLNNDEYKTHFEDISDEAAKSFKQSTAKAMEGIDEKSKRIMLSHYQTLIHDDESTVKTIEENLITTHAKHLENFGHTGFSKMDASKMDAEQRKRAVLTLAGLVERYHGKVEDIGITDILNQTIYNANNKDTRLIDLYQNIDGYFAETKKQLPSRIAGLGRAEASKTHNRLEDYDQNVSQFKEVARKLLPLKEDASDDTYALMEFKELSTLHGLHKEGKLTKDVVEKSPFAKQMRDMYSVDKAA